MPKPTNLSNVKYLSLPAAESYVSLDLKPETGVRSNCFNQCVEKWKKLDSKALTIVLILILLIIELTVEVIIPSRGSFSASLAEVFYYVNYVNVNYSVKNSTVDCKYLLYFL